MGQQEVGDQHQQYHDPASTRPRRGDEQPAHGAEGDDELMMKYFDGEELTDEEIAHGLQAVISETDLVTPTRGTAPAPLVHLPVFRALRHQHGSTPYRRGRDPRARWRSPR